MIHTPIGVEGFRKGMDLYFQRHDGQAVTCEDFVAAMEDASGTDLTQFRRCYAQSGTPKVIARWRHDPQSATLTLDDDYFGPEMPARGMMPNPGMTPPPSPAKPASAGPK